MPASARLIPLVAACLIAATPAAFADDSQSDVVKRGEYLARAGDCFSCHTKEGGQTFAGGRMLPTPYGSLSTPNITPDKDTGIGKWSDDDFYKLMHDGIDREGNYVYPIMPFDHYTKVSRDDVLAIKAYLSSLQPVQAKRVPSTLIFPFNVRASLAVWRALFFKEGTFAPDPKASDEVNRGAYLVEGLGHCGSCHTPRNIALGSKTSEALGGGEVVAQGWFAPNISSDVHEGIGSWTDQQLSDYLKSGVAPGKGIVAGPMMETVHDSLRYMTDTDIHAIAAYLKTTPPKETFAENKKPVDAPGATAYLTYCASCHQQDGKGIEGAVPPLVGNGAVMAGGPQDVIRTILGGMPANGSYGPMPGFSTALGSAQIADIANYVRTAWSNAAPATATTSMVDDLAKKTPTMLSGTSDCPPVGPKPLAASVEQGGVGPLLHEITPANMLEKIDAIVAKVKDAKLDVSQADLVNGLTAAYCPVVGTDTSLARESQVRQLQRFATLLYSQLASKPELAPGSPVERAEQPTQAPKQN